MSIGVVVIPNAAPAAVTFIPTSSQTTADHVAQAVTDAAALTNNPVTAVVVNT
jgi:hypothetical protein